MTYSVNFGQSHCNFPQENICKFDFGLDILFKANPFFYSYKYIVDGEWVCSDDDAKNNDFYGNINNYIVI